MKIPPRLGIAIPNYMEEKAYKEADMPPGHRFNLYAPMWVRGIAPEYGDKSMWDIGSEINKVSDKKDFRTGETKEGHEKRSEGGSAHLPGERPRLVPRGMGPPLAVRPARGHRRPFGDELGRNGRRELPDRLERDGRPPDQRRP